MSLLKAIKLRRESIVGFLGSASEAYNMAIYVFLAPALSGLLFPEAESFRAIIYSYILSFVGAFVAYPLGAIYYGAIGDREGRRVACTISSLGLAVATGLMGLVPILGFEQNAWMIYLMLCSLQFFFSGGEYHSSVIFSLEHGREPDSKGLLSGFSCLFAVLGICLAKVLSSYVSMDNNMWRFLFLLGFFGGLLSFSFKYYCEETPDYLAIKNFSINTGSYKSFLSSHKLQILRAVMVSGFFANIYSFIFIFLPIVMSDNNQSNNQITIAGLFVYGIGLLFSGWLSDFVGETRQMKFAALCFSVFLIPLLSIIDSSPYVSIVTLTVFACFFIGPMHSWLLKEFSAAERCRGIMVSSAISSMVFSGTMVPISLFTFEQTQSIFICSLYPFIMGFIVFSLLYFSKLRITIKA